jgi:hypothetical protein
MQQADKPGESEDQVQAHCGGRKNNDARKKPDEERIVQPPGKQRDDGERGKDHEVR